MTMSEAKRLAGEKAIEYVEDGMIVGEERRTEGVETVHELARTRKRKANA